MTALIKLLRVAVLTHKTVAAIAATTIIAVGTYEYLTKRKQ